MATVLDLAGIEAEHDHFAYSLKPQLAGEGGDPDRAVFTEGGYARHEPHCFEGNPDRDQFARNKYHIYYPKGQVQQQVPRQRRAHRSHPHRSTTSWSTGRPASTNSTR